MASVARHAQAAEVDRRAGPRRELCLGVTLRRSGTKDIIPAEITNLSANGFLAEFPGGDVPEILDVELPYGGGRTAQVVWTSGRMAGCSFTQPLTKPEISAAHLKSEPRQMPSAIARALVAPAVDPTDPIWNTSHEVPPEERWPRRTRVLVIGAASTLTWGGIGALVALFV